jgi:hypothetical protein
MYFPASSFIHFYFTLNAEATLIIKEFKIDGVMTWLKTF